MGLGTAVKPLIGKDIQNSELIKYIKNLGREKETKFMSYPSILPFGMVFKIAIKLTGTIILAITIPNIAMISVSILYSPSLQPYLLDLLYPLRAISNFWRNDMVLSPIFLTSRKLPVTDPLFFGSLNRCLIKVWIPLLKSNSKSYPDMSNTSSHICISTQLLYFICLWRMK